MVKVSQAVGRPRNFDEHAVVQQAVTTFWKHGAANTTIRVLESELGLKSASIYNTFGTKQELLHRALQNYLDLVAENLLVPLEAPGASSDELVQFIDDFVDWVTDTDHPGCLMLNVLGEQAHGDESMMGFADLHRTRMRTALRPALARIDESQADARAQLIVAGVIGMSIAARGGANRREMADFANALQDQIRQWAND